MAIVAKIKSKMIIKDASELRIVDDDILKTKFFYLTSPRNNQNKYQQAYSERQKQGRKPLNFLYCINLISCYI